MITVPTFAFATSRGSVTHRCPPPVSAGRALTLGVQTAPSVIIQSHGKTGLTHPPVVCETAAHRVRVRLPETLCSDRAKATAGQKLSQAGMSHGKETIRKAGFCTSRGPDGAPGSEAPAALSRPAGLETPTWPPSARLWRQQRRRREAPSAHPN